MSTPRRQHAGLRLAAAVLTAQALLGTNALALGDNCPTTTITTAPNVMFWEEPFLFQGGITYFDSSSNHSGIIRGIEDLRFKIVNLEGCEQWVCSGPWGIICDYEPRAARIDVDLEHIDTGQRVGVYSAEWTSGGCVTLPGFLTGEEQVHVNTNAFDGLEFGSGFRLIVDYDCVVGSFAYECWGLATLISDEQEWYTPAANMTVLLENEVVIPPTPIAVVGIEVTQSLQDLYNSVPLVADKSTYVRVHVEPGWGISTSEPVRGSLRVSDASGELGTLEPVNIGGGVLAQPEALERRGNWNDSLNFRIPTDWCKGALTLELQSLDECNLIFDCARASATSGCSVSVEFIDVDPLKLETYGFKFQDASGAIVPAPSFVDAGVQVSRAARMFPVPDLADFTYDAWDISSALDCLIYGCPPSIHEVAEGLMWSALADGCFPPYTTCETTYLALGDSSMGGVTLGTSSACTKLAAAGVPPTTTGLLTHRIPHELGHTFGLNHVAPLVSISSCFPVTGLSGCGPILSYDYDSTTGTPAIGPTDSSESVDPKAVIYGIDTYFATPHVIDPKSHRPLMSYCEGPSGQHRWIARPEYEHILAESLPTPAPVVLEGTTLPVPIQVASGALGAGGSLERLEIFSLDAPALPPAGNGPYSLVLEDASGATIGDLDFDVMAMHDETDPSLSRPFLVAFAPVPGIARARVVVDDEELGAIEATSESPTIDVLPPIDLGNGSIEIGWTSTDEDSELLSHVVEYSPNGGTDWRLLGTRLSSMSIVIDAGALGGTNDGLVRVRVSDGINTAEALSPSFALAGHAPAVEILSPTAGVVYASQNLILEAAAVDAEDGPLTGGALVWSANGVHLGSGTPLVVPASSLPDGSVALEATATDASGNATTASTAIELVSDPACASAILAYGEPLAGTGEVSPRLSATCPSLGNELRVFVDDGLGGTHGCLVIGLAATSIPAHGGTQVVVPAIELAHQLGGADGVAGAGTFEYTIALPSEPSFAGVALYWQALYIDESAPEGISMSAGLRLTPFE